MRMRMRKMKMKILPNAPRKIVVSDRDCPGQLAIFNATPQEVGLRKPSPASWPKGNLPVSHPFWHAIPFEKGCFKSRSVMVLQGPFKHHLQKQAPCKLAPKR